MSPSCEFCDGTGLWPDPDADPPGVDPCPLCEGSGGAPTLVSRRDDVLAPAQTDRLSGSVGDMTQDERQRIYEDLHLRYGCRIYYR